MIPGRRKPMSERRSKRRKRPAAEKLRIVLAGMQEGVEISELCRREGINPTMYYGWRKKLLASATKVFDASSKKEEAQQQRGERELSRLKDVIAEITAENLELKKTFSD
jgi:transposase-like protein